MVVFKNHRDSFSQITVIRAVFCLLLFSLTVFPLEVKAQNQKSNEKKQASQPVPFCQRTEVNTAILKIRNYLEKAKTYKISEVRGKTIINLNSLLFECDADFAKNNLLILWQNLTDEIREARNQRNNLSGNSSDEARNLQRIIFTNQSLQRSLIIKLKSLDPLAAEKLLNNLSENENQATILAEFEENLDLNSLTAPKLNQIKQLFRALPIIQSVQFLFNLKKKNQEVADILYVELLKTLKTKPELSLKEVSESGVYLFTSRIYLRDINNNSFVYNYLPTNQVALIDLTVLRDNVNNNILKEYFGFISVYLRIPVSEVVERTHRYVFGRIMLGHSLLSAPEFAGRIREALQLHFVGIPENLKDESFYQVFRRINTDEAPDYYEQNIEDLQKTTGADERDDKAVRLIAALYRNAKYEQIEKICEFITNAETKSLLINLTFYAQALKLIENKDIEKSLSLSAKINHPTLKALIWSEIDKKRQESAKKEVKQTDDFFYEMISNSKKIRDGFAPAVLFWLAKTSYRENSTISNDLMYEAISMANRIENWSLPGWDITISTPTLSITSFRFPLKENSELNTSPSLEFLVKNNQQDFEGIAFNIKAERIQSELFFILSKKFLSDAKEIFNKTNQKRLKK